MRMKLSALLLFTTSAVASLSAHIMVAPLQSKAGATQRYEVRVHNDGQVAATAIDLDVPEGVTVAEILPPPAGTYATKTSGDRITQITWTLEVPRNKYLALPFTAKNPDDAAELHWSVREHLADGTTVDWSDNPGAQRKGSVTKIEVRSER